jgi:pimeloyl-ACP methyl ester carboxylesterase
MNRKLKSHSFRTYAALGTAAGAAALALMVTTPAGATEATEIESHHPGAKPPVVLVHGSFADSSSWNGVVKDLKRSGIAVIAPADPLRGCTETPTKSAYINSAYIPHDQTEAREQATTPRAGAASRPCGEDGSGRPRPMLASAMAG